MENITLDLDEIEAKQLAGIKTSGYIKTLVEYAAEEMAEEGIILEEQVSMVRNYLVERVNVLFRPVAGVGV